MINQDFNDKSGNIWINMIPISNWIRLQCINVLCSEYFYNRKNVHSYVVNIFIIGKLETIFASFLDRK